MLEKFDASTCTPREVLTAAMELSDDEFRSLPRAEIDVIGRIAAMLQFTFSKTDEDRKMAAHAAGRVFTTIDPDLAFNPDLAFEDWLAIVIRRASLDPTTLIYDMPSEDATEIMRRVVIDGMSPEDATRAVTNGKKTGGTN